MSGLIRVAAIQMDCFLGDKQANMTKVEAYLKEAVEKKCQLIVLPELFLTGYKVDEHDSELAETIPGSATETLGEFAQAHHIFIAGAIIEMSKMKGIVYDTAFLQGPQGLVGTYRKVHLWSTEHLRFKPGSRFPMFETSIGKIGMLICYDIGFPEPARAMALMGVDMLLYPSAFGAPRLYAWDIATRSRALENGLFVIAANRSGQEGDLSFAGHTRIVDPTGEVISQADQDDQLILADIDIGKVESQRKAIPYLRDLRDAAYYIIT